MLGVLDEPATGLHEPLLQAGQRPTCGSSGEGQPPPEVSQVVDDHVQPELHFVGAKSMTAQTDHLHRVLTGIALRPFEHLDDFPAPVWIMICHTKPPHHDDPNNRWTQRGALDFIAPPLVSSRPVSTGLKESQFIRLNGARFLRS